MGQTSSTDIHIEKYIQNPFVTREDVYQIKNCFEYLNPKDGIVDISRIDEEVETLPSYMQEIIDELKAMNTYITFDQFYEIMKPRVSAMKSLPDDFVVRENTSASVFCVFCPYKAPQELSR
ncbi:hypothetical protein SteCoe_23440 [Stentor coeruleus]|uniref:Uncharacterized protein n=1 Tax=Stentor coeruleus TaxID=5963 RepID=A0A1R2BJT9_9CILI|nr:hypothetical protein SteCoe_23440 [Stentor coeruleus]